MWEKASWWPQALPPPEKRNQWRETFFQYSPLMVSASLFCSPNERPQHVTGFICKHKTVLGLLPYLALEFMMCNSRSVSFSLGNQLARLCAYRLGVHTAAHLQVFHTRAQLWNLSPSSPLCINQAAGKLRNMMNALAGISPAAKTERGRGDTKLAMPWMEKQLEFNVLGSQP